MPTTQNIFSIGRDLGSEDQLTEMLAWLSRAVPEVAGVLIDMALHGTDVDLPLIQAETQRVVVGGRLDLYLRGEGVSVIVESKLKATYGDDQLGTYLEWLSQQPTSYRRALMTLTASLAPWPAEDRQRAKDLKIVPVERRWHELHSALFVLTDSPDLDDLPKELVAEFLDMLTEEGLVPVQPLASSELADDWSKSQAIIDHYHDFFRACKDTASEALGGALAHRNRSSFQRTYVYQDFVTDREELIGLGFGYSDYDLELPKAHRRGHPYLWITVEAGDWPDWTSRARRLERHPPEGWRVNEETWWGRPQIWRYLDDALGVGSFENQQAGLSAACQQGLAWLKSARPRGYEPSRRRRRR
jgi:hypothetical protein